MKFDKILVLIFGLIISLAVSAQLPLKQYELVYKNNSTVYIYAGIKSDIRLINLPYNADYIQVVVVNNPDAPKARLIGKRKLEVTKANSSFVDFILEMDEVSKRMPFVSSLELKIKAFSKINEKYEIVDKISMFIRPIMCSGQDDEVCAVIKTKCHSGNPKCIEREITRNFKSKCDADKHGAELLHSGVCNQ